jgi:hypothetical protein
MSVQAARRTTIRPLRSQDFAAAARLVATVFGRPQDEVERVWRWRLEENPAAETLEGEYGWLVDGGDGLPVGVLVNLPQMMWLHHREELACTASHYAVDAQHRSYGLLLASAFIRQPRPALLLNTTANPTSRDIFRRFGFTELSGWNDVFLWALNPLSMAATVLARKTCGKPVARIAAGLSRTTAARSFSLKRGWPRLPRSIRLDPIVRIDEEFDALWQRLRSRCTLTAVRTARVVEWRFHRHPLPGRRCHVLGARDSGGTLLGYVAWRRADLRVPQMTRARIVDLFASPDDEDTVRALVRGAIDAARGDGAAVLEIAHVGGPLRTHLRAMKALRRTTDSGAYLYKWARAAGATTAEDRWYATGIDGDFGL